MLGFDSENRLFKSQRLQTALAFCHTNVENWYREVRLAPNLNSSCSECSAHGKSCKANCHNKTESNKHKSDDSSIHEKQLITKEVLEKFPKPKKWYKHFKILSIGGTDNSEEMEKIKSIDRYKDMSKLIEEKFGRKSHNPVKKSASFMFSSKRIDLAETPTQITNNAALLKCQSLDTQLFVVEEKEPHRTNSTEWKNSKSSLSDNLSYDFQMCILDNDDSLVETRNMNVQRAEPQVPTSTDNLDEIKLAEDKPHSKPKKSKPDLIPTLGKEDTSYITDRLCSEFHVKTKVQKRSVSKHSMLSSNFEKNRNVRQSDSPSIPLDVEIEKKSNVKSVIVQIHETKFAKSSVRGKLIEEDIPYCQVADEVSLKPSGRRRTSNENIYAEICDGTRCRCETNSMCKCANRKKSHSEYCYVKLGSNGESVTSDSDEAIYNTLR